MIVLGSVYRSVRIACVLFLAAFVVFGMYDWTVNEPRARKTQQLLSAEFARVVPPPRSRLLTQRASHKTSHAFVGGTYSAPLTYLELARYYDEELARNGWRHFCDTPLADWGRDLGGRARDYRKGPLTAELFYGGARSDYGWTYTLDLSWGLHTGGCP
jgi:hypothetical protein